MAVFTLGMNISLRWSNHKSLVDKGDIHVLNDSYKLEPKVQIKNNVAVTKHSTVLNMNVLKSLFCQDKKFEQMYWHFYLLVICASIQLLGLQIQLQTQRRLERSHTNQKVPEKPHIYTGVLMTN